MAISILVLLNSVMWTTLRIVAQWLILIWISTFMEEVYSMCKDLLDRMIIGSFRSKINTASSGPTFKVPFTFYNIFSLPFVCFILFFHCPKLSLIGLSSVCQPTFFLGSLSGILWACQGSVGGWGSACLLRALQWVPADWLCPVVSSCPPMAKQKLRSQEATNPPVVREFQSGSFVL